MWRESEDTIGDLLRSDSPHLRGQIDYPERIGSWWAANNINIRGAELNRQLLFDLAGETRDSTDPDWVSLLWHVLAWGVMGDFRNAPAIVKSAADQTGRSRVNEILGKASAASYVGDIRSAYRAMHKQIPRLGPAFFTKFLYFTGNVRSEKPRTLILDSRVSAAVFALTGTNYSRERPAVYERFCVDVHRWAKSYETTAELIEFRLYKFGQLIDTTRWKWLHAEASLYRSGATNVTFDEIVERVALKRDST